MSSIPMRLTEYIYQWKSFWKGSNYIQQKYPVGVMVGMPYYYVNSQPCSFPMIRIGVAICNKTDKWNRKTGIALATHRCYIDLNSYDYKIPKKYSENIIMFINRCNRYFKGYPVIMPRIEWI